MGFLTSYHALLLPERGEAIGDGAAGLLGADDVGVALRVGHLRTSAARAEGEAEGVKGPVGVVEDDERATVAVHEAVYAALHGGSVAAQQDAVGDGDVEEAGGGVGGEDEVAEVLDVANAGVGGQLLQLGVSPHDASSLALEEALPPEDGVDELLEIGLAELGVGELEYRLQVFH